jgi:hypothetical protein
MYELLMTDWVSVCGISCSYQCQVSLRVACLIWWPWVCRDDSKDICNQEAVVLDMGQYEYASMAAAAAAAVAAEEGVGIEKGGKTARAKNMLKRLTLAPEDQRSMESLDRLRRLSMARLKGEAGNTSMKVYQVSFIWHGVNFWEMRDPALQDI